MKMISWNVNGIRAAVNKGFEKVFQEMDADIFCIQESKIQIEENSKEGVQNLPIFRNYNCYWNSAIRKGYSGTAVFTKKKPIRVQYGIGTAEHDTEGRVITLEFDTFYFVTEYTPNSKRELERLDYRMVWEDAIRKYLCTLQKDKPVILCGDLNVAHEFIDIKNAKANVGNSGFTDEERAKFTELLEAGFIDTFRHQYPDKENCYTWWSYMGRAREKNIGWRIDYFIISKSLESKLQDAMIYPEVYGSDHCPVGIEIDLP